jgi:hypothetical protein
MEKISKNNGKGIKTILFPVVSGIIVLLLSSFYFYGQIKAINEKLQDCQKKGNINDGAALSALKERLKKEEENVKRLSQDEDNLIKQRDSIQGLVNKYMSDLGNAKIDKENYKALLVQVKELEYKLESKDKELVALKKEKDGRIEYLILANEALLKDREGVAKERDELKNKKETEIEKEVQKKYEKKTKEMRGSRFLKISAARTGIQRGPKPDTKKDGSILGFSIAYDSFPRDLLDAPKPTTKKQARKQMPETHEVYVCVEYNDSLIVNEQVRASGSGGDGIFLCTIVERIKNKEGKGEIWIPKEKLKAKGNLSPGNYKITVFVADEEFATFFDEGTPRETLLREIKV